MTPNIERVQQRGDRRMVRRRVQENNNSAFKPGQRIAGDGSSVHGGGGPENSGAKSSDQARISLRQSQPSWQWEDDIRGEYFGHALPSNTPVTAGIPANNFRFLGDNHGGRG